MNDTSPSPTSSPSLCCAILACNVENHIAACVQSCLFADRVVVFDTRSSDGTVAAARAAGAEVVDIEFINFSIARNTVLSLLHEEWVFFVDADERVTPELAAEVQQVIQRDDVDGWWVPRYNYIVGHVMRGTGWYPDHQLRLLRRSRAHYDPEREVHEVAIIDGREDYLSQHLVHYNYDTWAQFHAKQRRYTIFEAATLRNEGVHAHFRHLFTRPAQAFVRRYITWRGYRDGWRGLQLSLIMAGYEFLKYWWLWRDDPLINES